MVVEGSAVAVDLAAVGAAADSAVAEALAAEVADCFSLAAA